MPNSSLHHLRDGPGAHLTVGEQLKDPAAYGIPEYVECVHDINVSPLTYISASK